MKNLKSLNLDLEGTPIDDSTALDLFNLFKYKNYFELSLKLIETNMSSFGFEICYLLVSTLKKNSLKVLE